MVLFLLLFHYWVLIKLFQFVMYHSPGILRLTNKMAPLGKDKLHYRIRMICFAGNLPQD